VAHTISSQRRTIAAWRYHALKTGESKGNEPDTVARHIFWNWTSRRQLNAGANPAGGTIRGD
jgi:hypothetical protein